MLKWRRRCVALLAAVLAASALSGCTLFGLQTSEKVIIVAVYGGAFGDALQDNVIEPFEEKYDVRVQVEVGVSTTTLGKLRQQRRDPQIDVAWLDGGVSEQAATQGLVAPIARDSVTNMRDLYSKAVYEKDGDIYALGTGYYALGLVYNSEQIKPAPTSWDDLWHDEYAGKVAVPSPSNAMGLPFLNEVSEISGGDSGSVDAGLERLAKLEVASYFDTAGTGENLLGSNEVLVSAGYASSAFALADRGEPISYAVPQEGALAGDIRAHLVSGTDDRDLATKLIDLAVSKQAQAGMASDIYVAPVNKRSSMSSDTRSQMPYGADGRLADLKLPDWFTINANRAEWTDQFNRTVVQ